MKNKKQYTQEMPKPGFGWAYMIQDYDNDEWVLCHWVKPGRMCKARKPSPEAKLVRVKIIRAKVGER